MPGGTITEPGLNFALERLYNASKTPLSVMNVGVSGIDPTVTDTELGRKVPIQVATTIDDCSVTTGWNVSTDATALATNTSIFSEANNGSDDTALDLGKSGTTTTIMAYDKAVTSFDVSTADDWVAMMLFFVDQATIDKMTATAGIQISLSTAGFGTDDITFNFDRSYFTTVFNIVIIYDLTSPDSSSGSTDLANITEIKVQMNTNATGDTITSGDMVMDIWWEGTLADYDVPFQAPTPTFDTVANTVQTRSFINSTQVNGMPLQETGVKNTDSPPILYSHDTYSLLSKSNTDEVIFVITDIIETCGS